MFVMYDNATDSCANRLTHGHAARHRREQQQNDLSSIKPPPETLRVVVLPDGGRAIAFEVRSRSSSQATLRITTACRCLAVRRMSDESPRDDDGCCSLTLLRHSCFCWVARLVEPQ